MHICHCSYHYAVLYLILFSPNYLFSTRSTYTYLEIYTYLTICLTMYRITRKEAWECALVLYFWEPQIQVILLYTWAPSMVLVTIWSCLLYICGRYKHFLLAFSIRWQIGIKGLSVNLTEEVCLIDQWKFWVWAECSR